MTLEPIPETWTRALAVVAHPDDLEYGAASASARWTAAGRSVGYVIVTDGEAGIDAITPVEAAVLRQKEQLASAAIVGVEDVSFLHHPDGVVEYSLPLRRDIARHIRRFRPDVLLTASPELTVAWVAAGGFSIRPTTASSGSLCWMPSGTQAIGGSSPSCSTRTFNRGPASPTST